MTDPDAPPRLVFSQIIDAIRHGLELVFLGNSLRLYSFGIVLGPQLTSVMLLRTHPLLLLGVHGHRWLVGLSLRTYHRIDVRELGRAIRMLGAFQALLGALQARAPLCEHARHGGLFDVVPSLLEGASKMTETTSRPQHTACGGAACRRLEPLLAIGQQWRGFVGGLFSPTSRPPAARGRSRCDSPRFDGLVCLDPCTDGGTRHPGGARHGGHAAATKRHGLAGSTEPATALTQAGVEMSKPLSDCPFGFFSLTHAFSHESMGRPQINISQVRYLRTSPDVTTLSLQYAAELYPEEEDLV